MRHWSMNVLLVGWSATAVLAALSHFFLPAWTAAGTVWPSSPGWQREIAYFDVLLAIAFTRTALRPDVSAKVAATTAIVALSAVLGLHHLQGWRVEPRLFHVVFTAGNAIAVAWGVACLAGARRAADR